MSHVDTVPAKTPEQFAPLALGLDSLLWRWAGDTRMSLTGLAGGVLQLMYPGLGAGVTEHSDFFNDPWDRIERSMPEINGVVYDSDPEATGKRVRNYHRRIKGIDWAGRPYDALEPETFWWAHATFQHMVHEVAERFSHTKLTFVQKEQLYREGVEWYRRYQVPMDVVPPTRAAFTTKWSHICTNVLEMTPAAERTLDIALNSRAENLPQLPSWSVPLQRQFLTPIFRVTLVGGLPAIVRDRFGIPWSIENQLQLRVLERFVQNTWRFLPEQVRFGPRALQGRRAARAAIAAAQAAADLTD